MGDTLVTRTAAKQTRARPRASRETRVKLYLTYPSRLVREPLIYKLSRQFDLVFNIRQASVSEEVGIIAIELDGPAEAIERGIAWLREQGVTVEPIEKNVIE
jgi:ABC-type methionine transport system ATPase subunit